MVLLPAVAMSKCSASMIDTNGSARAAHGLSDKDDLITLVCPDGYVGLIASQNWVDAVNEYRKAVACVQQ